MLELYHHGSSTCAAKVRFALAEKNLTWHSHYIDILAGEQFSNDYLTINPKGVVPALVHDGKVITESSLICEYVEDVFPEPNLLPQSPIEKHLVRTWTKVVDEELHPACSALTYVVSHRHTILRNGTGNFEDFVKAGSSEGLSARKLKWQWIQEGLSAPGAKEKITLYLSYLDKMEASLSKSKWLAGDAFSLADIAMAPYLNRLSALAMDSIWKNGRLPNVNHWFEQIQARKTFQTAIKDWIPKGLHDEMLANGKKTWPEIQTLLAL